MMLFAELEDSGGGVGDAGRRRPRLSPSEVAYHVALWKIVKGKGSLLENLAIVAGYGRNEPVTVDAVKAIVKRVEHGYAPEEIEPADELDNDDKRYLAKRYRSIEDPAVREWLRQNTAPTRKRPDWRGSDERAGKVSKPRRPRLPR